MHQRKRSYYSETQKSLMWDRWQRGESLQHIADLFDRHHSAIPGVLIQSGGIRPPRRRRSLRALRPAEREEISRGVATGKSIRSMAVALNRAPSTISRELQRNQGRQRYRAAQADQDAWDRALRPKLCKLALHRVLAYQVAAKLRRQWSPEQVAGWLGRNNRRARCEGRKSTIAVVQEAEKQTIVNALSGNCQDQIEVSMALSESLDPAEKKGRGWAVRNDPNRFIEPTVTSRGKLCRLLPKK